MSSQTNTIIYTLTDEAPALATRSLMPILQAFARSTGVDIVPRDISLAARILAQFPEHLSDRQRQPDALAELGMLVRSPDANIIKLPNISASVPQLDAAIRELQQQGYAVPDFPEDPQTDEEREVKCRYRKVLGSAANPVLRQGNSDRRVAAPVKQYARKHPHSVGDWSPDCKSRVAHMEDGDFYASEQSHVVERDMTVRIERAGDDGNVQVLKKEFRLDAGEVIDGAVMRDAELCEFFEHAIQEALNDDLLLSLHLKATMMKVSDPIIFGHAVRVYFQDVFEKHAETFARLGIFPRNGLGRLDARIAELPEEKQAEIRADMQAVYEKRPRLAMVNSDKGITNLHVPSDVIIDASMPAVIRNSGKMWGADGELHDTLAIIPDRCYAGLYQEMIDFCKEHGAFDVTTMGSVSNVGLMARKAEEYGSHDTTFEIEQAGTVRVVDREGRTLLEHRVEAGDIWRMCQTADIAIRDWVKLAVGRARATGSPAIFWLDPQRAHDSQLIKKVREYLKEHDTEGLEIQILSPAEATRLTCRRTKDGEDTISVTGNVLRDYLTDLFPILEVGTSAKMLSIVPLLAGGGLFETGAGGSAPKHVQQFVEEGHLRWDSLGEFLALGASLEHLSNKTGSNKVKLLAETLDQAIRGILENNKSPSRKVKELDNRGSHFYLALYWARALAEQQEDSELRERFGDVARQLAEREGAILDELTAAQGHEVDLGGYYHPAEEKAEAAMRPSATLNAVIDPLTGG